MTSTPDFPMVSHKIAALAATLAIVVGLAVLAGWTFDVAVLKRVLPIWVAMKANSAVGFILVGIAMLLSTRSPSHLNLKFAPLLFLIARLCCLLAGLIGLLTLAEYLFTWNPGFDQWLFFEPVGAVGTSIPGRMAPETAACFVLLATALWTGHDPAQKRWSVLVSVSLGLVVLTLALAAMQSYLTPQLGAFGWFGFSIMAMHTSALFALLALVVIATGWRQDSLSWSLSKGATLGFASSLLLLVVVGLDTSRAQFWQRETIRQLASDVKVLDEIGDILNDINHAQTDILGYVVTGDKQFLNIYPAFRADIITTLNALRQGEPAFAEPIDQFHYAQLDAVVKATLQWQQQAIDARRHGVTSANRNNMANQGEALTNTFNSTIGQIKSVYSLNVEQLRQELDRGILISYLISSIGSLASLTIFLMVIFRLNFAETGRNRNEVELRRNIEGYKAVTLTANDAIITIDSAGNIVGWNQAAERMFGYREAEISGQAVTLLLPERFHREYQEGIQDQLADAAAPLDRKPVEFLGRHKNGSEFTLELSVADWATDQGRFLTGFLRDITERKTAEEQLRKLSLAVEQSPESILITNIDAEIEYANKAFFRLPATAAMK